MLQAKRVQVRQGDVLLTPVEAPPEPERACDASGAPLAGLRIAGERTGHAHELPGRVYDVAGKRLVFLERPTAITHQEHEHVELPAGWWEVRTQREFIHQAPVRRWD